MRQSLTDLHFDRFNARIIGIPCKAISHGKYLQHAAISRLPDCLFTIPVFNQSALYQVILPVHPGIHGIDNAILKSVDGQS